MTNNKKNNKMMDYLHQMQSFPKYSKVSNLLKVQ